MSSRDNILKAVKANQPARLNLPDVVINSIAYDDVVTKFASVLSGIGGVVIEASSFEEVAASVKGTFHDGKRIVSMIPELALTSLPITNDPHLLENVELAIITAEFGVAENGALWITDKAMGDRALPFICQHLALIVKRNDIVHTLYQAYERIGSDSYDLGIFIAGPSKTADIEQSLVLGAHGARSLTVFLIS